MSFLKYQSVLKQNNLSDTKTRRLIFDILQNQTKPYPVTKLVYLTSGKTDKSSVYRTVDVFEKIGIIKKVYSGWKENIELGDMFSDHHHHMTCTNCATTISFEESKVLVEKLHEITKKHNFHPVSHSIEFTGLCNNCSFL